MARSANDNDKDPKGDDEPTGRPCSICGKPAVMRYNPFCSRRCADVDLGRWLSGSYAVPSAPEETEDDDEIPGDQREP
jgi:endogenous inhibitor of DNA gyrase (YacG/DUF329 family)